MSPHNHATETPRRGRPAAGGRRCLICGRAGTAANPLSGWAAVRPGISSLIAAKHPGWGEDSFICREDLAPFRRALVEKLLADERGELGALERRVIDSLEHGIPVSRSPAEALAATRLPDRLSDQLAALGGSWGFLIGFFVVLIAWMALNVTGWLVRPFDPYPFILLNLVLSCLAAIQAPVILMSQRRQEAKDRQRAEDDYAVNLKAELEIRHLNEKIDHQLARQWERLAELQEIQIEMLEDRRKG